MQNGRQSCGTTAFIVHWTEGTHAIGCSGGYDNGAHALWDCSFTAECVRRPYLQDLQ